MGGGSPREMVKAQAPNIWGPGPSGLDGEWGIRGTMSKDPEALIQESETQVKSSQAWGS